MMFYYMFINICSVVSYLLQRYNFFETNKIFCTTFNMLFILNFFVISLQCGTWRQADPRH